MADSNVDVTAGTGTSIDTRTEATNGHHRQVVVLGDPSTNAGVAPVDATNGLSVDVKASALPTGAATSAKQDTIIGHLDGVEGLLTTIDSDTGTIATEVAGLLTDTELRATPVPISVATIPSHAVTNAGTFATQVDGAALTSLQLIDDAVYTDGSGTVTKGIAILGQDGTNPQAIKTDASGELQVDVLSMPSTTVTATDLDIRPLVNTDVVTAELSAVDNAVLDTIAAKDFATQTTLAAINTKLVSGTDIGDVTINNSTGASAVNIQDGGNSITVDNGGTFAVQSTLQTGSNAIGKLAANSGVDIGDVDVISLTGSSVAHDGADAGNPHKIGGRAQEPTTALDEVADNDRVDAAFDRQGRLATWMGYPVQSAVINTSTSGNNTIVAALGAGLRIAVLGCVIVSDGTTDVRWEDGASGTAKTGQIPLQAREGFVMPIGPQPWFVGSANTLLNLELTAAVNVHGIVSYVTMTD